jgi:pimeloyl-ACP methyl ester carboxylesterase
VLKEQGAERAVVGGLSMGAAVALALARAHPASVRALVLASFPPGRGGGAGASHHAQGFADAIEREGLEAAGARFVWGPDSGLDERGAALVRQGFLEHTRHGLAGTLRGFLADLPPVEEIAEELASVAIPTLVVAGALDAPSLAACRALAAALPDARLEVIPGAGHVVNLARPAAFDAALGDFLDHLPAES